MITNLIYLAGPGSFGKKLSGYLDKMGYTVCVLPKDLVAQKEALKDPEVEALFVVTPNDQHCRLVEYAMKEGRHHVFVEKPITDIWWDALAISTASKQSQKVLMVGHNQRREAVFRRAKDILDSGKIGRLVSVYFNYSHGGGFNLPSGSWRADPKRHREGPLITLGSHCLDTLHYLFGSVESVSAIIQNLTRHTEAPDSNAVLMKMDSGVTVFLQADYNLPSEKICLIHGTEGVIGIDRDKIHLRIGRDVDRKPSEYEEIPVVPVDTIEEELKEFFAATEGKARVETGCAEGLNVMMVLECCVRSHREKRMINVHEVFPDYFL